MSFRQWLTGRPYQPPFRLVITTLDEVKRQLEDQNTTDDTRLTVMAYAASAMFVAQCRRTFVPYYRAMPHDWTAKQHLRLEDDLLSLVSVADYGGTLTSGQYVLKSNNRPPYDAIQLLGDRDWMYNTNRESAITVTGTWGYNPDPSAMWLTTTTLSAAVVSTSATSISVTSAAAFEVLSTIKIDDEYMLVTAVQTTPSHALTVQRGINGSTAATHLINAPVSVYQQIADVNRACAHLAIYLYQTRDQFGQSFATIEGNIEIAKNIPDYVIGVINAYKSGRKR